MDPFFNNPLNASVGSSAGAFASSMETVQQVGRMPLSQLNGLINQVEGTLASMEGYLSYLRSLRVRVEVQNEPRAAANDGQSAYPVRRHMTNDLRPQFFRLG